MKIRLLLMIAVLLMGVFVLPLQAYITDVTIQPEAPTTTDFLSVLVSGEENFNISVSDYFLTIDETLLELDIHLQEGMMPVVTPWSHTEGVGILPVGTYDLTVNTWIASSPTFNDTYYTSFEVVPEPTTLLLISTGILCLRRKKSLTKLNDVGS